MLSEEKEILEYIRQSFELKKQKAYKPAIEMLYKALNVDNDNIEILFQLGELYFLMNNYERAIDYFEQVFEKNPNHKETLKFVLKIYKNKEEYEKALNYAQKLPDEDIENLKEKIFLLGKLHKTEEIKKYTSIEEVKYEVAKALYENDENVISILENLYSDEAKLLLCKIYFNENNLQKAKEIITQINSETHEYLNYKGLFALEEMNFVEAIKCFSKACSAKQNPIYFYNLGNAYFFNGWFPEAQKAYSKAIYLAPNNSDYRYSLAYLYYSTKDFDKCKKEIDAISKYPQAKILKALLHNNKNEYDKALKILEENVKNGYDDDFTLLSLSKTYTYLEMFEKAEKTIKKVIEKNPDNMDYLSDLADIYIREKEYDKAIKIAKDEIKSNPNYVYGYILAAKVAYYKEDYEQCKEYAQEIISLDMNCAQGYYYLALVRYDESDYEEAIECMKRAILYDATNPLYYAQMSKIYKAKKDYKSAFDYITEATNIEPSEEYKILYKELAKLTKPLKAKS